MAPEFHALASVRTSPHPQASSNAHVRPQWTLEVDPGRYLVVATVGDRNVSFAANLEVGGQPVFAGDWIDAGSFRSRCVLCVTLRGAITVSPHWPPRHGGAAARAASPLGYGFRARRGRSPLGAPVAARGAERGTNPIDRCIDR